jgi:hypothetical protein
LVRDLLHVVHDGKVGDGEEGLIGVPEGACLVDSTSRSAVRAQLHDSLGAAVKAVQARRVVTAGIAHQEAKDLIDICANRAIEEAAVLGGGHGDPQQKVVEVLLVLASIAVVAGS